MHAYIYIYREREREQKERQKLFCFLGGAISRLILGKLSVMHCHFYKGIQIHGLSSVLPLPNVARYTFRLPAHHMKASTLQNKNNRFRHYVICFVSSRAGKRKAFHHHLGNPPFQRFPRVTSIGSLTPKTLGKSRGPPQNPAEPRRTLGETPAEPYERPPQSPLRGNFPRRASRRVVPLGWWPSGTPESILPFSGSHSV